MVMGHQRGLLKFSFPLTEGEEHIVNTAMENQSVELLGRKIHIINIHKFYSSTALGEASAVYLEYEVAR